MLVTKNYTLPKSNPNFLAKKEGYIRNLTQKLNQLRFGSTFQGKLKPINNKSLVMKIFTPP